MLRSFAFALTVLLALATDASAATDSEVALSEVAPPPPAWGVDAATLEAAAKGEIQRIHVDGAKRKNRRVLVSVALVHIDDTPVGFTVNAILRDAKSGTMIAIIEGRAHVEEGKPTADLKKQVAHAAVRSAVRQIPQALAQ